MTFAVIVVSRTVFWMSTTGVSPVTVIVSATAPTFSSVLTVAANEPVSSMPSRLTVVNPANVNSTAYVPGRRSTIRYTPASSVTAERTFSMSAGLDASTVTPGSTAPDESLTTPVIDAWAYADAGKIKRQVNPNNNPFNTRISSPWYLSSNALDLSR